MKIIKKKVSALKLDPGNLRMHGAENVEMLKKSLSEFGQYKPLIVDKATSVVKIGNGRLKAMQELGWEECQVIETDFDRHAGMEVIDNRLNELSAWNDPELDSWLLNEKGIDWWGVNLQKSYDLLEKEKKKVAKKAKEISLKEKTPPPLCPHCGKPLKKIKAVLL